MFENKAAREKMQLHRQFAWLPWNSPYTRCGLW